MIDWAAAHFGTGLGAASTLRSRVLEALGAEQEWLSRDEDEGEDTVLTRCSNSSTQDHSGARRQRTP